MTLTPFSKWYQRLTERRLKREARARQARAQLKRARVNRPEKFELESFEPRLLLAADLAYTAAGAQDVTLLTENVDGVDTLRLVDTIDPGIVLAAESLANIDGSSGYGTRIEAAGLAYTAAAAQDMTLRTENVDGVDTLRLVDTNDPAIVLAAESLANIDGSSGYGTRIEAAGFDVTLRIDASAESARIAGGIVFVGGDGNSTLAGANLANAWTLAGDGSGNVGSVTFSGVEHLIGGSDVDTLAGPALDTVWNITGQNAGNVERTMFEAMENLLGAAGNEDVFVVGAAGSLSGVADGGADGFDTLVLDGGSFGSVNYIATGPMSGTIERDGDLLRYDGLEPIFDNLSATDRVITTSNLDDRAILTDNGGTLTLAPDITFPTFESITFAQPTNSLTINLGGDLGIPIVSLDRLTINSFNAPGVSLTVNGGTGTDDVVIAGAISGAALTVNAETITVNAPVTTTGDITLNAAAILGTIATPDTLPAALLNAAITVNDNLSANNITLIASTSLVSSVVNLPFPANNPLATLTANVTAEVAVTGNAAVTAAGNFFASAQGNVNATVVATAVNAPLPGVAEIGIAAPVINNSARSHLSGNATVSAGGTVTVDAATNTIATTTANGVDALTGTGAATAAPVIIVITEAFIDGAASVTQSDSIDIDANATSTIITTAISTPLGALLPADTLADLAIATSAGTQTMAAAIAVTSLTASTRAYLDTSGQISSSGAVSLLATTGHNVQTLANATPAVNDNADGSAVAVNFTLILDEAFVDNSPTIDAPTLTIATGGGSILDAEARSGAAGTNSNPNPLAGALAINTNRPNPTPGAVQGNLSHAYFAANAAPVFVGTPDVFVTASNTSVVDVTAEPLGAASVAEELGVGRSVALNIAGYNTLASIQTGASINGVDDLALSADGDQTALATALAGALAGVSASAFTVAGSITGNGSLALVDVGATVAVAGVLTVQANHRGSTLVRARSDAAAAQGPTEALALPLALALGNDVADATIAGTVTATGTVTIASDADVENQAEGIAGVQGGDPDAPTSASDLVAAEIAFLSNRANLAFGSSPTPPTTDPDVNVDSVTEIAAVQTEAKAAALGVNLSNAQSSSQIAATGNVTSTGGNIAVNAGSDVDSNALGSASAVLNVAGIAAGIAVNVQNSNLAASISGTASAANIDVHTFASGDGIHSLEAQSVSGTGIQAAGIAGAVAVTVSLGNSTALIGSGAVLNLGSGGDVVVDADMTMENITDASPFVDSGTVFGIGGSVELNAGQFRTVADIQDAAITGADDVSVLADGSYAFIAQAEAGLEADGGLGAAVAALLGTSTTQATVGNSTSTSTIGGDLTVRADHFAGAVHSANADVGTSDVGAGAAVAVGMLQGGATAQASGSLVVGGTVTVLADTESIMDADAIASTAGVENTDPFLQLKLDKIITKVAQALRPALEVDPAAGVNGAADRLTIVGHGLTNGDLVTYEHGEDETPIGDLESGHDYFVHVIDADTISLHAFISAAESGAFPVDLEPTAGTVKHALLPGLPRAIASLIETMRFQAGNQAIGAAAAIAANLDFTSAVADIGTGADITSGGIVTVTSRMDNDADARADALAVDSALSLGVAAAANLASQLNQASIAGDVTAPAITVQALLDGDGLTTFEATAVSGAGGGFDANLGLAGAFALNMSAPFLPANAFPQFPQPTLPALPGLPRLPAPLPQLPPLPPLPPLPTLPQLAVPTGGQHLASILDGANLTLLGGGDLLVRAIYDAEYLTDTHATPLDLSSVGIGPSVSINAMTQFVQAEIRDAVVTGTAGAGSNIELLADGDHFASADATAGATQAVNLSAAVALNYNDVRTVAQTLATTNPSAITGTLTLDANHDADTIQTADTESGVGGTASIGAAIAIGIVEGGALASSGMTIDAGAVSITADSRTDLDADAVSGQSGAEADPAGDPVSEQVEAQIEGLLAMVGLPELPEDVVRILQRASAETADGPIGAAAAVAANLDFGFVEAALADSSDLVTLTSPLVQARGDMDADALADATTVGAANGVGVAVAFNVDAQRIESIIGGTLTAPSVAISTGMIPLDENRFEAVALSGAGSDDITVAGAFALNLSSDPRDLVEELIAGEDASGGGLHSARIADGANITLTTASPVNITADYEGRYIATATADLGGGDLAIGPSVAVNAVTHRTLAELGAAVITGQDPGDGATDVNITANGDYDTDTVAVAGAVGNAGTLPAAVALTATSNDTIARVRPGADQSVISGNLNVTANHVADTDTLADALSGGSEVGLGLAIAAGGPLGGARADAGANMDVAGNVTVLAQTDSTVSADAFASQLGTVIGGLTVDAETERQIKRLATIAEVDDILFPFIDPHPQLQGLFNAETDVDAAADTIRVLAPQGFDIGDAVRYQNNEDDTSIPNLVDGNRYFISFDANDPTLLQLHATRADALARTSAIDIASITDAEDRHSLVVARVASPLNLVNDTSDTVNLGGLVGIADGDAVKYFNSKFGNQTSVEGLVDGQRYFVNVDDSNPNDIKATLHSTRADALAGVNAIDIDSSVATGSEHRIVKVVDAYHDRHVAVDPRGVDGGNDRLNFAPQTLATGDSVVYRNAGDNQNIGTLVDSNQYFVRVVTDDKKVPIGLQIHNSLADANNDANRVDLEPTADASAIHRLEPGFQFNPGDLVNDDGTLDLSGFQIFPVETVVYRNGGGASIGGLVDDAVYYLFSPFLDSTHVLVLNADGSGFVNLDASVATGTQHRFERVQVDAVNEENVPAIRMGAAAAIAVGAGRPMSHAAIGPGATIEANQVTVTADMDYDSDANADGLAIGGPAALGVAAAGNYSEGRHIAEIGSEASVTANSVTLKTVGEGGSVPFDLDAEAAAASLGLFGNAAASVAVNALRNLTAVRIGEGAFVDSETRLELLVNLERDAILPGVFNEVGGVHSETFAGQGAFGGLAAAGAAVAGSITLEGDRNEASIGEGAIVIAPESVEVRATTLHDFTDVAFGGSISPLAAMAVGAAFNYTDSEARAQVDGSVTVQGADSALNVIAYTDEHYSSDAASIAFGALISVAGAAEVNVISNTTRAGIGDGLVSVISADHVTVDASDTSELDADTGVFAAGFAGAVGASAGVNIMSNRVEAFIGDAIVNVAAGNDIAVTATSEYDVGALAIGLTASGLIAGVANVTYNDLANVTSASLRPNADVNSGAAVLVTASDTSDIDATAGGITVGGLGAVGASVSINILDNLVEAYTDNADASAAAGSSVRIDAETDVDVDSLALGFSAAGLVGGFVTVTSNEVNSTTAASARNGGTITGDTVTVEATDDSELDADATGAAFGGLAGVGGSIARNKMGTEVTAGIGGAEVTTDVGDVVVNARSTFDVESDALAFSAAGLIGGVGTVTIVDTANKTRAYIDNGSIVSSAFNVFLDALDNSSFDADSGGASVSGLVDVGLSFASSKVINDVLAYIDGAETTVTAAGAVDIDAAFSATIDANAVGFSVGALAAASGGVAVVESGGLTEAAIKGGATVNAASVSLQATATPALDADAGGFAGSSFAAAGLMIAEAVAGHSARAEATGVITTGSLEVLADATRIGAADANFFGIALFTGEVALEAEKTAGDTEAVIGAGADITITGGGNVTVSAESTDVADPTIVDVAVGAFMIGAQATAATVESNTRTRVAGRVRANNVSVTSVANKTADATTTVLNVSILNLNGVILDNIAGALPEELPIPIEPPFDTDATATISGANEATLASGADIATGGALTLTATSTNYAEASNSSGGATFVNVSDTGTHATAGGATRVQIAEGVTLDVDTITSTAYADTDAVADEVEIGVSGVNINLESEVVARTSHEVSAVLGPKPGDPLAGGVPTNLTVRNGALLLFADSDSTASVDQVQFDASLVDIEEIKPEAEAGGTTRALLGGAFVIDADAVTARANSDNDASNEAIAVEVGAFSLDQSERSVHTTHATSAYVSAGANLSLAGIVLTLDADSVSDATIDQITPLDLTAIDIDVVQATAEVAGSTTAHVDEGAVITAADLNLTADSDNNAEVTQFQFSLSGFNLEITQPTARTNHTTTAYAGPAAGGPVQDVQGTITIGGALNLHAQSTNDAEIQDIGIDVSALDISEVNAEVSTRGLTRAHIGGKFTVNATGVAGEAISTNRPKKDDLDITLGAVTVATNNVKLSALHFTEAFITREADFVLNGGMVELDATSTNDTQFEQFDFTLAGADIEDFKPEVEAGGATRAYVEEGASLSAGGLDLDATSNNTAALRMDGITLTAFELDNTQPTVRTTHETEVYVGPGDGVAPDSALNGAINVGGGTVSLQATTSNNLAEMGAMTVDLNLVTIDEVEPTIVAGGATRAHLGGNFEITAGTVEVRADSPSTRATTETFGFKLAAFDANFDSSSVRAEHLTEVFVGNDSDLMVTGGPLLLAATSTNRAEAETLDISIGLANIGNLEAEAEVLGTTRAFVGDNAEIDAGNVTLSAVSTGNVAVADQTDIDVGLINSTRLEPRANSAHNVEATTGAGSDIDTGGGDMTLTANSVQTATAKAGGVSVSAAGVANMKPDADAGGNTLVKVGGTVHTGQLLMNATANRTADADLFVVAIELFGGATTDSQADIGGTTKAIIGGGAVITATDVVRAQADSIGLATANSEGGTGGVFTVADLVSNAGNASLTEAFVEAGGQIAQAGNVDVKASGANVASATTSAASGGFAEVRGAQAFGTANPTVKAYIGDNASVDASGNVLVLADSIRAEADARATSNGGGVFDIGAANAVATSSPTIDAHIGAGAVVTAGNDVTVEAIAEAVGEPGLGDTFNAADVNLTDETIKFNEHGLASGDNVVYDPAGAGAIGTPAGNLASPRDFTVIVVDDDHLRLGAPFDTIAAPNAGSLFTPGAGVDSVRDIIRFAVPHRFDTGDAVRYDPQGGSALNPALNAGGTYFVRKIDDFTIKLALSSAAATSTPTNFGTGNITLGADDYITLPGFADGQAVTYRTPLNALFTTEAVDGGTEIIRIEFDRDRDGAAEDHGLQTGDRVTYFRTGATDIGPNPGQVVYVIRLDPFHIRLSDTQAHAIAGTDIIDLTPGGGDDDGHVLVRQSIGLTNGRTYYVVNAGDFGANTFQLSEDPGGVPLALSTFEVTGTHTLGVEGIELDSTVQNATQILFIDFNATGGDGQKLLGPNGVSLRTIAPPPGNGISEASASGGSGGFAVSNDPDGKTDVTHNVAAWITATSVDAGHDVVLRSISSGNGSAYGSSGSGGFIQFGNADAHVTFANTNRAFVGTDTGGGNFDASGTTITAGRFVQVDADSGFNVTAASNADGGGFISDSSAESTFDVSGATQGILGAGAAIETKSLRLRAGYAPITGKVESDAVSGGLFGGAHATNSGTVNPSAQVLIQGGGLDAFASQGIDLHAFNANPTFTQSSEATCYCIGEDDGNNNDISISMSSLVDTADGALLTAGPRVLAGPGVPGVDVTPLAIDGPAGFDHLALYVKADGPSDGSKEIQFDADVVILAGPSPDLVIKELGIGADGAIEKAINITVERGQNAIDYQVDQATTAASRSTMSSTTTRGRCTSSPATSSPAVSRTSISATPSSRC